MRFWKPILIAGLALVVTGIFSSDAYARRGGGSSSRSSSSSSSWGSSSRSSSQSRASMWGSSSRSSQSTSTGLKTSGTRTQTPVRSAADQKLYDKAKSSGTAYSSKSAATDAFKSKYSKQYTSRYASKPTTRPDHIPSTTSVAGKTYNITYDQRRGGYGYMGPGGSWVMYDAMADAAMLNLLMPRHYYYYDDPRMMTHYDRSFAWMPWIGTTCLLVIVAAAAFASVTK